MVFNFPPLTTYEECRAHINRLNAERSTGPRTAEGKARSSQNAFKHGLYSKQLIREGEDPAEFDELRATLRSEHQPANTTEEILVDELAHHFWRIRRFREMEARAWQPDTVSESIDSGLLALITRTVASAERGFFRALAALTKLQKARGFVPQKAEADDAAPLSDEVSNDEISKEEAVEEHADPALTHNGKPTHSEQPWLRSQNSPHMSRRVKKTPAQSLA